MPEVARTFIVGRKVYAAGDQIHPDDPVIVGRERLFLPVPPRTTARVEQATAAPGELRDVVPTHHCDVCDRDFKTAGGLARHATTHDD